MKNSWWKVLCVLLLGYTVFAGLLWPVPRLAILHESIRNLYFHVPMWFTMMLLFLLGFFYGIRYLISGNLKDDFRSVQYIAVGLMFGTLGMLTGMIWAKYTWGQFWSNDPKQLGPLLSMLVYFAYFILRSAIPDEEKKAKIAAVYSIFAFALMIPFIWILPSLTDSLHPGSGGNPGFNTYGSGWIMRRIFYPAVVGWFLLGLWISELFIRLKVLQNKELLNIIEEEKRLSEKEA